jgi:quercetin dioxygenase-like cupin family protein
VKILTHSDQPREEWRAGVATRMHVSARNGATQLCIFEQWVAPGAGAPTHQHPVEEVLTVLAGQAEVWINKEHLELSAGQSLVVPAGRDHGFRNVGPAPLHVHAVLASPFFEATFEGNLIRRWSPEATDG